MEIRRISERELYLREKSILSRIAGPPPSPRGVFLSLREVFDMEWTLYPFLALVLGEIACVDYREHAIYDFDTLLAFALVFAYKYLSLCKRQRK